MSVAIITGASSGIGAEFARQLKPFADEFWFVARRVDRMEALGEELGVKYKTISADLTTDEGVKAVTDALEAEKPSVKYLVNAAGFGDFGAFDELPESSFTRMIDLNVKSLVRITHATVPYMERGGRIIELGSGSAFTPLPYFNVYASTKAFVLHYTKALKFEIKKYGITATCFCPGWVDTEFIGKAVNGGGTASPAPSALKPLLNCKKVVRGCVKAANKGKTVYATGKFTRLQSFLYRVAPHGILSRTWIKMIGRK